MTIAAKKCIERFPKQDRKQDRPVRGSLIERSFRYVYGKQSSLVVLVRCFWTYFESWREKLFAYSACDDFPLGKNTADIFIEHRLSNSVRKTLTNRSRKELLLIKLKEIHFTLWERETERERKREGERYLMIILMKWWYSFSVCLI